MTLISSLNRNMASSSGTSAGIIALAIDTDVSTLGSQTTLSPLPTAILTSSVQVSRAESITGSQSTSGFYSNLQILTDSSSITEITNSMTKTSQGGNNGNLEGDTTESRTTASNQTANSGARSFIGREKSINWKLTVGIPLMLFIPTLL